MTNRVKLWLGASALALVSGALPSAAVLSPIASNLLGIDLPGQAWAQESGDEDAATECAEGEGEEGGECASEDEATSGEDGEGEGS